MTTTTTATQLFHSVNQGRQESQPPKSNQSRPLLRIPTAWLQAFGFAQAKCQFEFHKNAETLLSQMVPEMVSLLDGNLTNQMYS